MSSLQSSGVFLLIPLLTKNLSSSWSLLLSWWKSTPCRGRDADSRVGGSAARQPGSRDGLWPNLEASWSHVQPSQRAQRCRSQEFVPSFLWVKVRANPPSNWATAGRPDKSSCSGQTRESGLWCWVHVGFSKVSQATAPKWNKWLGWIVVIMILL